jgi:hypothetical protein
MATFFVLFPSDVIVVLIHATGRSGLPCSGTPYCRLRLTNPLRSAASFVQAAEELGRSAALGSLLASSA